MTLLSPAFLWAMVALLPLAAVYFLKVRPCKKTTPAFFLWEKVFSSKRATSLFAKLRNPLSLLLMALAFAAMVLAMGRPEIAADDRKDLLILIDHSASMGARDGAGTRLDAAKESAREIAIALNGNQRAAVAVIAKDIAFRTNLSDNPRQLLDAIGGIGQTDLPFSDAPLAALGTDAKDLANYRIILISDGNFEGAASLPEKIELLKVGAPVENLGIIGADLQRLPDGRMGIYFQIASSFKGTTRADLLVKREETGRIAKLIPVEAKPGVNEPEIFYFEEAPSGKWILELDVDDGFEADNRAWLAVPPERPVRVAVNAGNRFFFETAILAFERGGGLLQLVDDDPEIVVEHGQPTGSEELSIVFTPQGESPWWTALGAEKDSVAPREVVKGHPALRLIDVSTLTFLGAREITPAPDSLVLVESEDGNPLIYQATRDNRTALVVNLDPVASDLYFSAWFPVMVHGAATHLAGRTESLAPVYRPGDLVPVPGFREDTQTTLLLPGSESAIPVSTASFGPLRQLGFSEFRNPAGVWPVGSSLLTRSESLLDNEGVKDSARPISRGHSPSYWLLVVALLVLVGESILYHRRKVG